MYKAGGDGVGELCPNIRPSFSGPLDGSGVISCANPGRSWLRCSFVEWCVEFLKDPGAT